MNMRVLIIEDEHKIANALKKALQQENFAVDVSYDSDEGYAMASTEPYDVIIVDRMLPGERDGLGVVRELRQNTIHIPVLFLTALGTIADRTTGLDAGADDYLVKPFALAELLARVRALVRRPKEQAATILTAGDLSLNTITFEVRRGAQLINLTSKEFSLLEYLLRNQNRPISKDTIISHVWDYDADILPNTVEVYVRYLRNKIDTRGHEPLIHTVRGFGYKLQAT